MGIKFTWDKMEGDFFDKLQKPYYYVNAIKGSNLIVWIALSIKFFKMCINAGKLQWKPE